ncbi:hypothetical protein F5B18DRAFT_210252 [Nemania serpens]|nr:hypothetical protein F5B18DRAFT_210252 [Nemania serpens]
MTHGSSSPRRRHILSSINSEARSVSPQAQETHHSPVAPQAQDPPNHDEERTAETTGEGAKTTRKTSKFRFKSKHSRTHRSSRRTDHDRDHIDDADHGDDREAESQRPRHGDDPRRRHHHRHHHHRHKRRRTRSPSATPQNPYEPPPLDAEAAFRESLFDAMADDEGAAYWEGVYGQPIHVYGQERAGPDGALERMDDDEYAAHVRRKMWEKTHQGLLEERARRQEQRRQKERDAEAAAQLTAEMERSLRRGEERRAKRGWKERWDAYAEGWEAWDGEPATMTWPVRSGRREDVEAALVREFFVLGIDAGGGEGEVGEAEFLARLKDERVRWHPDKIQQRLGGRVDEGVMRAVTAVFQTVDRLWTDTRSKQADR